MNCLITKPTGYPKEIFEGEVFKKFQCIICKNILKTPVQVQCGHRSCEECFQYIVRKGTKVLCHICEEEGEDITEHDKMFPDISIKREMSKIPVKCCQCGEWTGSFKYFEVHYNTCIIRNNISSLCHENIQPVSSSESTERPLSGQNNSGIHFPTNSVSTNSMNPLEVQEPFNLIESKSEKSRKDVLDHLDEHTRRELHLLNIKPKYGKLDAGPESFRKEYAYGSGPLDLRSDESLASGTHKDSVSFPSIQDIDATTVTQQVFNSGHHGEHVPAAAAATRVPESLPNPVDGQGPGNIQGPAGGQIPTVSSTASVPLPGRPASGQMPTVFSAASASQLGSPSSSSSDDTIHITRYGPHGGMELHITGASKYVNAFQVGDNNVMHVSSALSSIPRGLAVRPVVKRSPVPAAAASSSTGAAKQKIQIVVPNRQVDRDILSTVANRIPKSWKAVGRRLNLTDDLLDKVEVDNRFHGVEETAYQMLNMWKQQAGPNATYQFLAKALVDSKRADVAKLLSSAPTQ